MKKLVESFQEFSGENADEILKRLMQHIFKSFGINEDEDPKKIIAKLLARHVHCPESEINVYDWDGFTARDIALVMPSTSTLYNFHVRSVSAVPRNFKNYAKIWNKIRGLSIGCIENPKSTDWKIYSLAIHDKDFEKLALLTKYLQSEGFTEDKNKYFGNK